MYCRRKKPFYCREWAFEKLNVCLNKRVCSATCGTLVMSDSGCGKTSLCEELVWPSNHGLQKQLHERLLAYHFCVAGDSATLSLTNFLMCLTEQLSNSKHLNPDLISYFKKKLRSVSSTTDVDNYMKSCILEPLESQSAPDEILYILIDGLDDSDDSFIPITDGKSYSVAQLLSKCHRYFPKWLALVCTCSSKDKRVTRMFTGFRKLSLDDVSKSYVVQDVQQYILHRLDAQEALRRLLNKDTAEILDKLHVKCNGCFLYIELILDLVSDGCLTLGQVRDVPGTLYGLFMWLFQKLFPDSAEYRRVFRSLFNILLAAKEPIGLNALYDCFLTKNHNLQFVEFEQYMEHIRHIVMLSEDGRFSFFHPSFRLWLQDIKFCSSTYLCSGREGHEMLTMYYTLRAASLSPDEVCDFAHHMQRCNTCMARSEHHTSTEIVAAQNNLDIHEQAVWMLLSGASVHMTRDLGPVQEIPFALQGVERTEANAHERIPDTDLSENPQLLLCTSAALGDLISVDSALKRGANVNVCDESGQVAIVSAASSGQLEVVQKLILEADAEVNLPDSENRTALRVASAAGFDNIVEFLLINDADVNRADKEGRTPLLASCYMGHHVPAEMLLANGADINHRDSDQRNALAVACLNSSMSDNVQLVKLLVQHGCDVNSADGEGITPLHLASMQGHLEMCKFLITSGAQVEAVDQSQNTPLLYASKEGQFKVVQLLLDSEADAYHLDQNGRSALSLACFAGHTDIAKLFLDLGQDEMHRDNYGVDCLHLSALEGHEEVILLLLEYGADVNSIDDHGRTSLYLAAQHGRTEAMNALLSSSADPNIPAHNGRSPLRVACCEGHVDCVQLLLNYGADVNNRDIDGRSVLYTLALENNVECVRLLGQAGADINATDEEGRTALHVACWQGHTNVVSELITLGCDLDPLDNERRTPLQSAVWQGHVAVVEMLCRQGADVNHMCDQGATPLCIAAQEGYTEVVSVLCTYGADPNHTDKFGRTAFKIAMKQENSSLLNVLENIMRKFKPTAQVTRLPSTSQSDNCIYANPVYTDQPESHKKLVSPYAVNEIVQMRTAKVTNLSGHKGSPASQGSSKVNTSDGNTNLSTEFNQNCSVKKRISAESFLDHENEDSEKPTAELLRNVVAMRQAMSNLKGGDSAEELTSSEDCDTIETSESSKEETSSIESSHSYDNCQIRMNSGSFSQQIVELKHSSVPKSDNIDDILSGHVRHMANPKLNKLLSSGAEANISGVNLSTRSTSKNMISSRQQIRPIKQNKMAAVQNTAREPAFKVQYALSDYKVHIPSGYSVRNDELMSSGDSLSSIKSRQAKIVNNIPIRAAETQLQANKDISRYSPPPDLPPRKGRPVNTLLQTTGTPSKPTLVGVVRPRTHQPNSSDQQQARSSYINSLQRHSQRETSL